MPTNPGDDAPTSTPAAETVAVELSRPPARVRLIQLDVLRGIAVLLVLLNHRPATPAAFRGWSDRLFEPLSPGYWSGVDLFFVLSGFLVGGLLIGELRSTGRLDVKRFWIRRGLKIWPSYYLYLIVLMVVTALFYVDHSIPGAQRWGLLVNSVKWVYLQNYFNASKVPYVPHTVGNHTWTLAVEEHFYMLLPLVLLAAGRAWRKVIPAVTLGLLLGCLAIRLGTYHRPMDWVRDYQVTHKRIDSLFLGVFLAYLAQERPALLARLGQHRLVLAVVGLLLVAPAFVLDLGQYAFMYTFGYTFLALGYGAVLLAFVTTTPGEGWFGRALVSGPARALAGLGFWSYAVYLWHVEWSILLTALGDRVPTAVTAIPLPWRDVWVLLYLAGSVGLGVLLGRLVEQPVLLWRDRVFPSRSRVTSRETS
ncbi:MAG: acyltransferase [Isosphaeraceae bacterium]